MDKDAILVWVYFQEDLRGFIKKLTPDLYEEAHSQFMLNLMLYVDEDKLIDLHESKELKYYSVRMIKNMVTNPRSPFNKKFRKNLSYDVVFDDSDFTRYLSDEDSNTEDNYINNEREDSIKDLILDVKKWLQQASDERVLELSHQLKTGVRFSTPAFDGADERDIEAMLELGDLDKSGKTTLFNGITGEAFSEEVQLVLCTCLNFITL